MYIRVECFDNLIKFTSEKGKAFAKDFLWFYFHIFIALIPNVQQAASKI
jgi:hypothetical protein